ncbi:winged helix-turn-helix transcriptional regulator [Photobacterium phosphoreum]|uniref:winged helix-turn-helix transcriptional regulator n=1 Tax=Photobacterium phosphoreum TaxID=659 RepID=UPI001E5E18F2|nr:helix-turn-helix domain-containing protein [Photobacterium phosphoreum]
MTHFIYPGKPVRGSESGNPIMTLFDLLGRRWAMGVLWQLCSGGPCTFRELQDRCESISPAVLNSRIRDLRQAKLLERGECGYQVTDLGKQIITSLYPLKDLAEQWVSKLQEIESE